MHASTCRLVRGPRLASVKTEQRVHVQPIARKHVCKASHQDEQQASAGIQHIASFAASAAIAAAMLVSPLPAAADLVQTVPASQMTSMARPIPKQYIDKGKVWTVFIGGAASLFLITVAAENNKSWFPAIARANAAMAVARKRAEQEENNPPAADIITSAQPAAATAPAAAVAVEQQDAADDDLPPLEIESAALEAEIERRNRLIEEAEERAEIERQAKLVEDSLLSVKKRVLDSPQQQPPPAAAAAAAPEMATEAAAAASSPSEHTAASTSAEGSSNGGSPASSSSSSDASAAPGYTVVAEATAVPEAVAWQGDVAAEPAAANNTQPVSAAALSGVLESRDLMQQYREQQKQQQQQQQEVRS